jgi:hypothetical protein
LEQLNSNRTYIPCHPEWVIVFLCQFVFSYVLSCYEIFQPRPICNYVHKIMLLFYVCFYVFLTLMWPPTVPWLFSYSGTRVARWLPLEKGIANGGLICAACLAWSYTLSVHTPPPRHCQLITQGGGCRTPLNRLITITQVVSQ